MTTDMKLSERIQPYISDSIVCQIPRKVFEDIVALESENENASNALDKAHADLQEILEAVKELKSERDEAVENCKGFERRTLDAEAEVMAFREKVVWLERCYDGKATQSERKEDLINMLEAEAKILIKRVKQQDDSIWSNETDIEGLQKRGVELESRLLKAQNRIEQYSRRVREYKKALEASE